MKSKEAQLTPEVLKSVLAVIGIVILIFFAIKLYGLFVNQDTKNAKAFIEGLSSKIGNLNDGQNNTFALQGVAGWVLVGWGKEIPLDKKPEKCFDKNCLCLCKDGADNIVCQQNGYCREIDRNVSVPSNFTSLVSISGGYNVRKVAFGTIFGGCYIMPEKSILIPFTVSKTSSNILITAPTQQVRDYPHYESIVSTFKDCPSYRRAEGTFETQRDSNAH